VCVCERSCITFHNIIVYINQILQSPDIYYRSELDNNGKELDNNGIFVTIISDWGGRLELEIDRKARIWARVSRKQKISILVLFKPGNRS
jgi:DNA-directed RNA polymerase subunit beta